MLKRASRNKTRAVQGGRKGAPGRSQTASKTTSWRKSKARPGASAKSRSDSKVPSRRQTRQAGNVRERAETPYESALKNFEIALEYFRKQQYEKAATFFQKAADSPVWEVAERARMHLRLCEQKNRQPIAPKTSEDFYLRGIAALNGRETEQAVQYFNQSDKLLPNQEHVQYALAAAHGLQGNLDAAMIHLQKAIELRPANRAQARFDEDFQALAADPRFGRLVGLRLP